MKPIKLKELLRTAKTLPRRKLLLMKVSGLILLSLMVLSRMWMKHSENASYQIGKWK